MFMLFILLIAAPLLADENQSTAKDRSELAVTIYNNNLALVREQRELKMPKGVQSLQFQDVSAQINPRTVHIKPLGKASDLVVVEQNFEYDLLSPEKLLEKFVGKELVFAPVNSKTGERDQEPCTMLSNNNGYIIETASGKIFNSVSPADLIVSEIPENLIAKPTLVWLLENHREKQNVEVSYLSSGMSWNADYVLVLDKEDKRADLTGWVTIENNSGTMFENSQLKLVAGDVNVSEKRNIRRGGEVFYAASMDREFQEESLFEYHMYTLKRKTTLKNNQSKQIELLNAHGLSVEKLLVLQSNGRTGELKPEARIRFNNAKKNELGDPMPMGTIRAYKADGSGALQFVGDDRIDHTAKDEWVELGLGTSFDVVCDRTMQNQKRIAQQVSQTSWRIEIRNHKNESTPIRVEESVRNQWSVIRTSHEWKKKNASVLEFSVDVPANGKSVVEYTVEEKW